MNKIPSVILLFSVYSFISLANCEDNNLWDLGLTIKNSKDISNDSVIVINKTELSISNKQIKPKLNKNDYNSSLILQENQTPALSYKELETEAIQALYRGQYKISLHYFKSIDLGLLSVKRKNNILFWIANSYFKLNENSKALEFLDLIVEPTMLSDDILLLKGMIYVAQNEHNKAIDCYQSLITTHPESEFCNSVKFELKRLSKKSK